MINTKALTELFAQNIDEKLCKQWWLMTPNGTLLAQSGAGDAKLLRRQVAIVTLAWQEHDASNAVDEEGRVTFGKLQDRLRALTIEAETNNIIATRVQPQLLLVLEGGVPPRRSNFEPKTTSEGPDDEQYPVDDADSVPGSRDGGPSSRASSVVSVASNMILRLQRRKLEAMANAIADDFEQTGFQMPIDGTTKIF
ncbi:hypothetical protein AMS68_007441 [Peltaster fructicola]|uniref:Roadblock/LAMTOR2 domain-containing protein n=1 Tax=Peltaster fructicola TaxID=286661 RepID=A0A6H0Y4I6_9PEZI|nr:hypothetical protein AMS68_007441 [Peltaster fructicola]